MGLEQIVSITHRNHFRKLFERKTEYIRFDTKLEAAQALRQRLNQKYFDYDPEWVRDVS